MNRLMGGKELRDLQDSSLRENSFRRHATNSYSINDTAQYATAPSPPMRLRCDKCPDLGVAWWGSQEGCCTTGRARCPGFLAAPPPTCPRARGPSAVLHAL